MSREAIALGVAGLGALGYLFWNKSSRSGNKAAEKKKLGGEVRYVSPNSRVVVVEYDDLVAGKDISAAIETAFGFDGLGLITIRGIPSFVQYRHRMLRLAQRFATLPADIKAKYEHPDSYFQFGWSHGKENLQGSPDLSKGSYYNNPVYDKPFDDEEIIRKYPSFAYPNIWPKQDLPDFEPAFKDLGKLIVDVGALLASHLDRFVRDHAPGYATERLRTVITRGRCHKARLLHYFPFDEVKQAPPQKESESDYGSWCGWHNDHGSLTGLCSAMYLNAQGEEVQPDPACGLYIRTRRGELVKAGFPADHLAFQMGETQQVHSGGKLRATPHCVRAVATEQMRGVSRETFAVFMEPLWNESMDIPPGTTAAEAQLGSSHQFLPKGVPPLEKRWDPSMDFGQFTTKTLEAYTVY